jgi:hypothetical protein
MFKKGGPYPWNTKPGGSSLDTRVEEMRRLRKQHHDGALGETEDRDRYSEKNGDAV